MRLLTWLHRWWGVVFCLLFAMWFASGIVMHFRAVSGARRRSVADRGGRARGGRDDRLRSVDGRGRFRFRSSADAHRT